MTHSDFMALVELADELMAQGLGRYERIQALKALASLWDAVKAVDCALERRDLNP
jgi:hypothetical protein